MDERDNGQIAEAEAILQRLRLIPPRHATGETVAAYQHALSLLTRHAESPLGLETALGLGSHLLESPDGQRAANIDSAKAVHRRILALTPETAPDVWHAAVNGLAQSLMLHPAATEADFLEASSLFDRSTQRLRQVGGDMQTLAIILGNSARMHS
jgi:hypothetical protein